MNTNDKESALKEAHARHVAAFAAMTKVEAAFPAEVMLDATKIEAARLKLEDCLVNRILDEATAADEAQARADLENAEVTFAAEKATFENIRIQRIALNRRLAVVQQDEATAKQALEKAEVEWLHEELRIADEAYTVQVGEVRQSYLRVSACAAALRKRSAASSYFSVADDMAIPAIGPVSCAAAFDRLGGRDGQSGHGKLLLELRRRFENLPKDDDVEGELAQTKSTNTVPGRTRFAKAIAALIPGAEK